MSEEFASSASVVSGAAGQLLAGLLRDASALVTHGVATPADIDTAMRLGAGHPRGPFEVMAGLTAVDRDALALPEPTPAAGTSKQARGSSLTWNGPVGVVGAGHMAVGIVEAIVRAGRPVRVLARSRASGLRLLERVATGLDRAVSRGRLDDAGKVDALGRISVSDQPAGLAGVDVVIEAVAEDLEVKAAVVAAVDSALPATIPLATNTSSFRVADLRPHAATGRPLLALHFFNPAQVMKLVEVVVPADVDGAEDLRGAAHAWARDIGKTPVDCADRRGFIVNRLLLPFLNDAVRLHESGVPVTEVDDVVRARAGHPMGPLALIDLIGLDVTIAALDSMAAVEADPRIRPAQRLRDLAASGRFGRKSGAGFHTYS